MENICIRKFSIFFLRKKINIKACVNIDNVTNWDKNNKTKFNNYQIIDKIDKNKFFL